VLRADATRAAKPAAMRGTNSCRHLASPASNLLNTKTQSFNTDNHYIGRREHIVAFKQQQATEASRKRYQGFETICRRIKISTGVSENGRTVLHVLKDSIYRVARHLDMYLGVGGTLLFENANLKIEGIFNGRNSNND